MRALGAAITLAVCLFASGANAQSVWQSFNQGLEAGQRQRASREEYDLRQQQIAACQIARDQALATATSTHNTIRMIVGDAPTAEQQAAFDSAYLRDQAAAQNNYANCLSGVR